VWGLVCCRGPSDGPGNDCGGCAGRRVTTLTTGNWATAASAALGALGLALALTVIGLAGHVGFGDVKLALSIGLVTGWHSWYLPISALFLAYLLAFPHAIIVAILRYRGGTHKDLPFGPYLIAGGLIALLCATLFSAVR
jgi:leader peptidase (prepilin peptidase)/N-methyltransferase